MQALLTFFDRLKLFYLEKLVFIKNRYIVLFGVSWHYILC